MSGIVINFGHSADSVEFHLDVEVVFPPYFELEGDLSGVFPRLEFGVVLFLVVEVGEFPELDGVFALPLAPKELSIQDG